MHDRTLRDAAEVPEPKPTGALEDARPGDDRLRIVHVVRQFHPGIGGLEAVVRNLAAQQVADGHHARVVTLDTIFLGDGVKLPHVDELDGMEIRRIPYRGSSRYPVAPAVLRHLRDADIVHVHGIDFFFDFLSATKWLHRKPLVVSTHGGFFHTPFLKRLKQIYFKTITRTTLAGYGVVAASSVQDEEAFRTIRSRGVRVVENGVDIAKFRDLGAKNAEKEILFFGRLAPHKNADLLFPFLRALRPQESGWRLTVAGKPSGVTIEDLREKAKAAGMEDYVTLVASPDDEELRRLVARSSVYVSASAFEGFGIAPIEAASAGLMPLLSDIPPHAHTLGRLGFGALVSFDNPDAAARRFLDEWREWTRDLSASRAKALAAVEQFGWPGVALEFEAIYRKVMGRHSRYLVGAETSVTRSRQLVGEIDAKLARGEPVRLAFLNANLANLIAKDEELGRELGSFMLVNDGLGVDIASRLLYGARYPENLNGTDFTPYYLDQTSRKLRLYLVGATPDALQKAVAAFRDRWPRHEIVGAEDGYFQEEEAAAVAERIRAAKPDLVLVGMGNPRQERWIARHLADFPGAAFAIGALFDFVSGTVPRAPEWVRKLRAEWIFRLGLEPRRMWRRYLVGNAVFLSRVFAQKLRGERAR